ncbi:MAG: PhzF family phenazine biosynthesis protein [Bacteroidota bacterium]|nr:PhzF family phenazine biosynthesis protein [Bacteroidota bacterium]
MDFSIISVFLDKSQNYTGNTAAVILLKDEWSAQKMQLLAADFNQPATVFLLPGDKENHYSVRWFAPDAEIGFCGHGSMAAVAYINQKFKTQEDIVLHYPHGEIYGRAEANGKGSIKVKAISDFNEIEVPGILPEALGVPVKKYYKVANKDIVLLENESSVKNLLPVYSKLRELKTFGFIVTAPGDAVDFVSRTFIPHFQQLEDPATGSSHAALAPFWSQKLNKDHLVAHQLSKRGGKFICKIENEEVILIGDYSVLASGEIF